MTYVPLSVAAELTGRSHCWLADQCRVGMITSARKTHPDDGRGGMPGWIVDLDELYQIDIACHRQLSTNEPWSPVVAAAPEGELTEVQLSHLANESWHDLLDLQPEPGAPGAIRLHWSDGESYILHPNGDTGGYRYIHPARRRLPPDDELLALAETLSQREIAHRYDVPPSTVCWMFRRIKERHTR